MAEKFATGDALNETFQFALNRWGTVLRFGWAPALLTFAISLGLAGLVFDFTVIQAAENDPERLLDWDQLLKIPVAAAIMLALAAALLISFLLSGFMASVFRLVALGEERPGFVHLRFDGPAQRVFIANVILSVINFMVYVGAFLIASIMTGISPAAAFGALSEFFILVSEASEAASAGSQIDPGDISDSVAPVGLFFVAVLFALFPLMYINVRLAPFLAGSAAENRLLLAGAFRLTAGNFWQIFLYYVLLLIVMMIIVFAFQIVMGIIDTLSGLPSSGIFAIIGFIAGALGIAASVAYQLFTYAIQFGGQGVIYRRLKTGA